MYKYNYNIFYNIKEIIFFNYVIIKVNDDWNGKYLI